MKVQLLLKLILKKKIKKVSVSDIQETISKIANIPENTIKSDERIKLNNLERDLKTLFLVKIMLFKLYHQQLNYLKQV